MSQEALNLGRFCFYIRVGIDTFVFFLGLRWWDCHPGDCPDDLLFLGPSLPPRSPVPLAKQDGGGLAPQAPYSTGGDWSYNQASGSAAVPSFWGGALLGHL